MKTAPDKVFIVMPEVMHALSSIQWAQEEIIDILEKALREGDLGKLPGNGCGLGQALKILNGAFEKITNNMASGEPALEPLENEKFEAVMERLRIETAPKVMRILEGEESSRLGGAA